MTSKRILRYTLSIIGAVSASFYCYLALFTTAMGWAEASVLFRSGVLGNVFGSLLVALGFAALSFSKKRISSYCIAGGLALIIIGIIFVMISWSLQ